MSAAVWSNDGSGGRTVSGPQAVVTAGDSARSAGPVGSCVDRAGTVTVQADEAGPLANVSFADPFTGSVVVMLTAASEAAAKCGLFVVPSSNSFTVHAAEAPGNTVTFSYLTLGVQG